MPPFRINRLLPAFLLLFASHAWACADCDCDDDKPATPVAAKVDAPAPAKVPADIKPRQDAGQAAPAAKTAADKKPS